MIDSLNTDKKEKEKQTKSTWYYLFKLLILRNIIFLLFKKQWNFLFFHHVRGCTSFVHCTKGKNFFFFFFSLDYVTCICFHGIYSDTADGIITTLNALQIDSNWSQLKKTSRNARSVEKKRKRRERGGDPSCHPRQLKRNLPLNFHKHSPTRTHCAYEKKK